MENFCEPRSVGEAESHIGEVVHDYCPDDLLWKYELAKALISFHGSEWR